MSKHLASLYTVRVRKAYDKSDYRKFGDIDGAQTYLGQFLYDLFDPATFESSNADGTKDVKCESRYQVGGDLNVIFNPGERGYAADIVAPDGQIEIRQTSKHTQVLKCASVFRLPRNDTQGWWIAHTNNGRRIKSLVADRIMAAFSDKFDDLVLEINPSVSARAFKAALDRDDLLSVSLTKFDKTGDIADRDKWVSDGSGLKVQTVLKAERGKKLIPTLAKKFLGGNDGALGRIVEFEGIEYDEAKLEVAVSDTLTKTYNLSGLDKGHAISQYIDPVIRDGDPTDASLFSELKSALTDLS